MCIHSDLVRSKITHDCFGEYIRTDNSFKELANNISEIEDQQLKTVKAH